MVYRQMIAVAVGLFTALVVSGEDVSVSFQSGHGTIRLREKRLVPPCQITLNKGDNLLISHEDSTIRFRYLNGNNLCFHRDDKLWYLIANNDKMLIGVDTVVASEFPKLFSDTTKVYPSFYASLNGLTKDVVKTLARVEQLALELFCADNDELKLACTLNNLRWFNADCGEVLSVLPLSHLTELEVLKLRYCSAITDLGVFRNMSSLRELSIQGAGKLKSLHGIENLNLQAVNLDGCPVLSDITDLPIDSLESVDIEDSAIQSLHSLNKCKTMKMLRICGAPELTDITGLSAHPRIESLVLQATGIKDISPLASIKRLTTLILDGNLKLQDISSFRKLKTLQYLSLQSCSQIQDFSALKELAALQTLILDGTSVGDLDSVKGLRNLSLISLHNCAKISFKEVDVVRKALPNCAVRFP